MTDELEEARERERIQQLKMLPFCVYLAAILFSSYWILLSDSIEVSGTRLYGFSKLLWFLAVDIIFGLSMLLAIGSLSLLIWMHRVTKYLGRKINALKPLSLSVTILFLCYAAFFVLFKIESYIRENANRINSYVASYGYQFDILELIVNFVMIMGMLCVAGFFTYYCVLLLILPFKAKSHAEQLIRESKR